MRRPLFILALLLTVCASLATYIEPRAPSLRVRPGAQQGLLETVMGDSRRLFATHFLLKADAYFHSGYYPGIFDAVKSFEESHLAAGAEDDGHGHSPEEHARESIQEKPGEEHDKHSDQDHHDDDGFLGAPKDWIDRFSRSFFPSTHVHLDESGTDVREILPWLRLSADLDPERVETYVVGAFWLRTRLGKFKEAEGFLRDGLRVVPGHPALLLELGKIRNEAQKDIPGARRVWELALLKWQEIEAPRKEPDTLLFSQIVAHLATLEENAGNLDRAIACWNLGKRLSPRPESIEQRIAAIRAKQAAAKAPTPP